MPGIVKCGLIQAKNAAPIDLPIEEIKKINIERHLSLIELASKQGAHRPPSSAVERPGFKCTHYTLHKPSPRLGVPTFALRTAAIGDRVSHARGCTGSIRSCGTAIGLCSNAIRLRDPAIAVRIAAIGQGVPVNARGIPADRRCGPVIGLRDPANALRIPTNRHCGRINAPRIPGDRLREVHIGLRIVAICLCVIDLAVRRGSLLRWRLGQGWEPVRRREIAAHPIGLLATTVRMCSPQPPIIS